jgi:predicted metal-dependent enzyme (double-stranded beta helix superfamily)
MAAAYGIEGYCRDLTRLIGPDTPAERCVEIARERCASMLKRGLDLRDEFRVVVPGQYSRNLVHRDPRGLFVVIALLWKPETASAIHDHTTWGVMGTYESAIECTNYDRVDDGSAPGMAQIKEREVIPSGEGNVEIVLPPKVDIHRMRNPTKRQTITIHTYGREVDACNVYDPVTCRMGTVSLRYANRPGEIPGASRIG